MRRQMLLVVLSIIFLASNAEAEGKKNGNTAKVSSERTTLVSWYNHGKVTANGERFSPNGLTVAHKHLPFGTIVKFTNPENNKVVFARVNDRGPYIKGREFDLTARCASILGMKDKGVVRLKVQIL